MKIKRPSRAGYGTLLALSTLSMCMVTATLLVLHNGYRAQALQRSLATINELASKDLAMQETSASSLMTQIVTTINSGQASVTYDTTAAAGSYSLATTNTNSSGQTVNLDFTDSAGVTSNNVTATATAPITVQAWSPTSPEFATLTLPQSIYSIRGGAVIGKQFSVQLTRTMALMDNLRSSSSTANSATQTKTASKTVQIFEFPNQTAVWGKNVLLRPVGTVSGSVLAESVTLDASVTVGGSVTVSKALSAAAGAQIGSTVLSSAINSTASAALSKGLETGAYAQGAISPSTLSVIRGNEFCSIVDLGDRTLDAEGIPALLKIPATPSKWDAYSKLPFQCSARIFATLSADKSTASVVVTTNDTSTLAGRIGVTATGSYSLALNGAVVFGMQYISGGSSNAPTLQIDPIAFAATFGTSQARAIYVNFVDSNGNHFSTPNLCVTLTNASNLSTLQGFSLVTANRFVVTGMTNTTTPVPLSIFATTASYGWTSGLAIVTTGQAGSLVDNGTSRDLTQLTSFDGTSIPDSSKTITLTDVANAASVPPVTARTWLILTHDS